MKKTVATTSIALLLALGSLGCDDKGAEANDAKADATAEKKEEASKDPKDLFTSKTPELPGPLANLKFGMSADEVKQAAPDLGDGYSRSKEFKDTSFGYYVPDESGKLKSMRVVVEAEGFDMEKTLTAAWGEPKKGEDLGKPKLFWFNPDKKMRATISQGYGKEKEVQFDAYIPATDLLGDAGGNLGIEKDATLMASTADDLKKNFGEYIEEMSKEEAEKQRKDMEKFAGRDLSALGEAQASMHLDLPPTEFGSQFTRINVDFGEDGKVNRYRTQITYEAFPAAKDEILGLLKAKWGEPKEEEKYGKKLLIFGENPRIEVEDNDITKGWDIEVEAGGK